MLQKIELLCIFTSSLRKKQILHNPITQNPIAKKWDDYAPLHHYYLFTTRIYTTIIL